MSRKTIAFCAMLTTTKNGHARGPTALSPAPNCACYAMLFTKSRATTATNITSGGLHALSTIVWENTWTMITPPWRNTSLSAKTKSTKASVEIKSIVLENDPANLRLFEAFYIRKYKPIINSREECSEFADFLFQKLLSKSFLHSFIRSYHSFLFIFVPHYLSKAFYPHILSLFTHFYFTSV